jgi:hypothetical protein
MSDDSERLVSIRRQPEPERERWLRITREVSDEWGRAGKLKLDPVDGLDDDETEQAFLGRGAAPSSRKPWG